MTFYLLISIILIKKAPDIDQAKFKESHLESYNSEADLNAVVLSMIVATKDLENSVRKANQEQRNKREHSKYGNKVNKRKETKNKRIKYIKISQLNK